MLNLNLDMKARLKNKAWWITIIGTIILLAKQCGFDLSQYIPSNYADIINTIFIVFAMVGITVDTSTSGISDKTIPIESEITEQANNINITVPTFKTSVSDLAQAITEIKTTTDNTSDTSSKITVDNPDNVQAIGNEVNTTSAVAPN